MRTGGYLPCDLCGASDPVLVLESPRLDGPLVRCRNCRLLYVGSRRQDFSFASADAERSSALADRVAELELVRPEVEDAERPWRLRADRRRLARLRGHVPGGRLLDVGCATGVFLALAGAEFEAEGVEPDPGTSEQARASGNRVITGTLETLAGRSERYDAVTMFHVLEHLRSPRDALQLVRELLRPGGVVMIETPTIDCAAFKLARSRWRQLIPDHYYFFSRATLETLLRRCDLMPVECATVRREVSLRFLADRLRRAGVPLAGQLQRPLRALGLADRTATVRPGDVMTVIARRAEGAPAGLRDR
ncbi:MAG: class I SAM-dependent methyltransferase [Solirubrobacterales bacterium]|nr:class I SAM-dependent methyltransferase [Solirubrobacterales bacterium]